MTRLKILLTYTTISYMGVFVIKYESRRHTTKQKKIIFYLLTKNKSNKEKYLGAYMQKIFLYFIIILSLIIGLIGCPNNPETGNGSNNDQTEQTQEAKNKATSRLLVKSRTEVLSP